ncbi:MAG: ABC transporter ATP-binding protein [Bacilli bacterium]
MALLDVKNLTFFFSNGVCALKNLSFQIHEGEFILLSGSTGSGKTTLLKLIKQTVAPFGKMAGEIEYQNQSIKKLSLREQTAEIGYVFQNVESQIVSDFVFQELAFGLENLGYDPNVIRLRVGEMASFFGITSWFRQKTTDLSGGQKQLLNLASIMVMEPKILLLDEPTSQLDPIAASEFLQTLKKLNRELGLTIIIVEHHLAELWTLVDRIMVLDQGSLLAFDTPPEISKRNNLSMIDFPAPIKIYREFSFNDECPLDVNSGKKWLTSHFQTKTKALIRQEPKGVSLDMMQLSNIWFRYEKNSNDILRGLSFSIKQGEIVTIVGGNGSGKSTLLKLLAGLLKPYSGRVKYAWRNQPVISFLPQNPQDLFIADSVIEELQEMESFLKIAHADFAIRLKDVIDLFSLNQILEQHPYDLSGGEQQKVALAKILLRNPDIILLDEPSKSLDADLKGTLKQLLKELQKQGKTIVIASHDIEFAALVSNKNAMLFDGEIIAQGNPHQFFSGNTFYTTSSNRLSRHMYDHLITEEEVVCLAKQNGAK